MNDESHSHKKATVVLVAVLLLAYVGSYLAFRQILARKFPDSRVIVIESRYHKFLYPDFLNDFYEPLMFLDYKATGISVHFTTGRGWMDPSST